MLLRIEIYFLKTKENKQRGKEAEGDGLPS